MRNNSLSNDKDIAYGNLCFFGLDVLDFTTKSFVCSFVIVEDSGGTEAGVRVESGTGRVVAGLGGGKNM